MIISLVVSAEQKQNTVSLSDSKAMWRPEPSDTFPSMGPRRITIMCPLCIIRCLKTAEVVSCTNAHRHKLFSSKDKMSQDGILSETADVSDLLSPWIHHSLLSSSSCLLRPTEAHESHSDQPPYLAKGASVLGQQHWEPLLVSPSLSSSLSLFSPPRVSPVLRLLHV